MSGTPTISSWFCITHPWQQPPCHCCQFHGFLLELLTFQTPLNYCRFPKKHQVTNAMNSWTKLSYFHGRKSPVLPCEGEAHLCLCLLCSESGREVEQQIQSVQRLTSELRMYKQCCQGLSISSIVCSSFVFFVVCYPDRHRLCAAWEKT